MGKKKLALWCGLLTLVLIGCMLPNSETVSLKKELQKALESYLAVRNEAEVTYNTDAVSNVATGQALENILNFVTMYKKLEVEGKVTPARVGQEFEIEDVNLLASGSSWAVLKAKKSYLVFEQDLQTGKRTYDSGGRRELVQTFLFVKEGGVWKVDRILE